VCSLAPGQSAGFRAAEVAVFHAASSIRVDAHQAPARRAPHSALEKGGYAGPAAWWTRSARLDCPTRLLEKLLAHDGFMAPLARARRGAESASVDRVRERLDDLTRSPRAAPTRSPVPSAREVGNLRRPLSARRPLKELPDNHCLGRHGPELLGDAIGYVAEGHDPGDAPAAPDKSSTGVANPELLT
jgi:hypothetical protein